jgi:signal transduction histidine kinase
MLGNLIDNALAVTPAGGTVEIGLRLDGTVVEWTVADDGPGIAAEHLGRVFDRFYRVDPSRARDGRGGAGIGLAVVLALARAHGGDVTVESASGHGARFTVRLPQIAPGLAGS